MKSRIKDNPIKALIYAALLLALLFKSFFPKSTLQASESRKTTPQVHVQ